MRDRRKDRSRPIEELFPGHEISGSYHYEKIRRWMLRILLLSDLNEFDHSDKKLLFYIGLDRKEVDALLTTDGYGRSFDANRLRTVLETYLAKLERKKLPKDRSELGANLDRLSRYMDFSPVERDVTEFAVLLEFEAYLQGAAMKLGSELSGRRVLEILSILLGYSYRDISRALSKESPLGGSSLLTLSRHGTHLLNNKLEFLSTGLAEQLYAETMTLEEILMQIVLPASIPTLSLKAYRHLRREIETLLEYLETAIREKRSGVNLLLYGPPGTGKTELARLAASELEANLYEVSCSDEDGDAMDGSRRLRAYSGAQALLKHGRNLLLYDEAEDIFESQSNFFFSERQKDKAWLNRTLESNPVPTFWITNRIETIDPAIIRRFDLSIELGIPPKKHRKKILRHYCRDLLSDKEIKAIAMHPQLAPAVVADASKVAAKLPEKHRSRELIGIIDRTLRAQGHAPLKPLLKKGNKTKKTAKTLPAFYDVDILNIGTNPLTLAQGLRENPNARLCFYGPPGTGKSALGHWLAKKIGRPVLVKKGSDLLSMWVGGTEKNIAEAFAEARKKKAVLIFDEVDSLLQDRRGAQRSWEVTQVNEMLVQMEEFDGIFIATTNLMEGLDPASLRRFDLKVEFGFMKPKQVRELFAGVCETLSLGKADKETLRQVSSLHRLTPGDFAAVVRQSRFSPIGSPEELAKRLQAECEIKGSDGAIMGFAV